VELTMRTEAKKAKSKSASNRELKASRAANGKLGRKEYESELRHVQDWVKVTG
jgi:hypothetical protein